MTAIVTTALSKRYPEVHALDGVSIRLEENRIHGLLGRNGAGKTTLMQLLTGQVFATSGEMQVLGGSPVENVDVLSQTVFIQESQKYPDTFRAVDVLRIAAGAYPHWDQAYADRLVAQYRLPVKRLVKKLSRGQLSAIGIVIGLAARAPLTFFDEPYLGLDAVARQMFFDDLLADYDGLEPRLAAAERAAAQAALGRERSLGVPDPIVSAGVSSTPQSVANCLWPVMPQSCIRK